MKKICSLSFLLGLFFVPVFSQAVRHEITGYGKSVAMVDARPFSVINEAFSGSLDQIINEKVLLVSEPKEKAGEFSPRIVRKSDRHQFYFSKRRHIGTVKIMPGNTQLKVPETAIPLPIQNP